MKKSQEQRTDAKKTAEQPKENTISDKKEAINAIDVEDKIELERREAYIEPKARDLLRKLLQDGDKEEIIPIYTPGLGFVYQITGSTSSKNETDQLSRDCLENLAQLNILQKSFFDSVSACPNCQSTIMTLHNRCPKCKSHNVEKTSLTEHIPCGYIDQRDKYIQNRCPKCGEPLLEGQYRNMGRWYVCQGCGEKFENPEFDLICRNCNKNFAIKEAQVTEIPKFSLNLTRKKEIRQNVASLEDIRTLLTELGFSIEMPGLTIGQKSGMRHHFSLIAKKQISGQEIVIALDHAVSESEVQTSPLILYLYKISEVKVDIPIFVAIPGLNDTAKKIAQGNNILLIEGSTEQAEAITKIKNEIEARINQINQKTISESKNQQPENKPETTSFFSKLRGIKKKNTT
jgi:ssDNA-binding Zn-finger/Zn-ribbon topoisomerase 1